MVEYRHSAHAVYNLEYHVIWITKYRYKILRGRVAERARSCITVVSWGRRRGRLGGGVMRWAA